MKRQDKYPETETFHFHNANPKGRLLAADCVARAVSLATGKTWEQVIREATEAALKRGTVFNDPKEVDAYLQGLGYAKRRQPVKADGTKYTVAEFCEALNAARAGRTVPALQLHFSQHDFAGGRRNKPPRVLVRCRHHEVCLQVVGGLYKACDTWDSTGETVGNFYLIPQD